uniref:4Fe-4S binding protein n=1 Tax=uncultured Aquincola sp. TaxID=886556 RepID=UPI0032B17296
MNAMTDVAVIKQHLIDPEICIRCNTCEATCPIGAITHDDRNYVVKADVCNGCMACISPCPTGSIDNWRTMPATRAYPIEEQLLWDELPPELTPEQLAEAGVSTDAQAEAAVPVLAQAPAAAAASLAETPFNSAAYGATTPPWSAAHAYTNLYPPKKPTTATVVGNINCTESGFASETHHVVLDFGSMPFPVLEGQSIGIIPPGVD